MIIIINGLYSRRSERRYMEHERDKLIAELSAIAEESEESLDILLTVIEALLAG